MTTTQTLCVTTDFMDDLLQAGQPYDEHHIDAMMAYAASLGTTRYEWVLDTMWSMYGHAPGGFDLLRIACDAAHRHGMRFDVVFKPFEGAIMHPLYVLPLDFPRPAGIPVLEEPWGMAYATRPFVAANPTMRMARMPGEEDPGGRIAAIRLVKGDDKPLAFSREDITLWTSSVNGRFVQYDGPMSFHEQMQWRACYPHKDQPCRIVTLGDLDLPSSARFLRVACRPQSPASFTHDVEKIVELVNEDGHVIPSTVSQGPVDTRALFERTRKLQAVGLSDYLNHPKMRKLLSSPETFLEKCSGMYRFESGGDTIHTLDAAGEVVVMRGKPSTVTGALSPAYPEVREHWLETVRDCLARGVDGVNIRPTTHSRPSEPWQYGFNAPVWQQMTKGERCNRAEAAQINGEAFDLFLQQAADMVHQAGRELGVHVHALQFQWDDRHGQAHGPLLHHMDLSWERWIAEKWVDYIEFRGADMLKPHNLDRVIDRIGLATRKAGIPLIYQSIRAHHLMPFHGPRPTLEHEVAWVSQHPDITTYNLYETVNFCRLDEDGRFQGSPDMAQLIAPLRKAAAAGAVPGAVPGVIV